jgi:Zn-dependent protease with chaperone function
MDSAVFEKLIARGEALAARNPTGYRWRVFGMAILGYGYLALVIALLVGLVALAVWSVVLLKATAIKLLVIAGVPLLLVLRSLWVRIEAPAGLPLTRENAPGLFQMLDDLRRQLDTPPLHNVLLDADFNAGVQQLPRLGLLGWHETYLVVGLPLMKALSVEQFRAVLAHELGHLSRGHARAGNWIYRLRLIWQRLDQAFSQTSYLGGALIRPFFPSYIPYFAALSFPLARANEYEADAASVRLTSARSTAQALTAVGVIGSYLAERYWPGIQARARDMPRPALAPYTDFVATAVQEVPAEELRRWQATALARKTSHTDTHPCLTDRLKGIGMPSEFAPPAPGTSADQLLGSRLPLLQSFLDEAWRRGIADAWRKTYEGTQAARTRLTELRFMAAQRPLEELAAVELAGLEEEIGQGPAVALTLRRDLAQQHPDSLVVRFHLARQLLRSGDAAGVAPMESVIGADPAAVLAGAELLRDYYVRQNDPRQAGEWHERLLKQTAVLQSAGRERGQLLDSDILLDHKLSPPQLMQLVQQLQRIPELTRVYLVRKRTSYFPDVPLYVLGFKITRGWAPRNAVLAHAILQRLKQEIQFPGETLIVNIEGSNGRLAPRLKGMRGARIL